MIYRLMQCTFKEVLCQSLGGERTSELFVEAGTIAGREFCRNVLDCALPFAEFVAELKAKLVDLKVGVLRIEQADQQRLEFVLTVSEDLDCSGLPVFGETDCDYDEGFIAGIFTEYTGMPFAGGERNS